VKPLCSLLLLILALAIDASAQQTVFVVRHAERADATAGGSPTMAADPDLSEAGKVRADSLAAMLKDANVKAIFTTEFKRTQQTAAPLAKSLGIAIVTVAAGDPAKLLQAVKAAAGNALVVGHSNTVPAILKGLGIATPVTLGDSDYDNLFVVTTGPSPGMLRLHFR
jgi:phosphohistidine phosphatase SixA